MDFGMFKIVCQLLLNFMNLLNSWLHDYGLAILALTTIIKLTLCQFKIKPTAPCARWLRSRQKSRSCATNTKMIQLG